MLFFFNFLICFSALQDLKWLQTTKTICFIEILMSTELCFREAVKLNGGAEKEESENEEPKRVLLTWERPSVLPELTGRGFQ